MHVPRIKLLDPRRGADTEGADPSCRGKQKRGARSRRWLAYSRHYLLSDMLRCHGCSTSLVLRTASEIPALGWRIQCATLHWKMSLRGYGMIKLHLTIEFLARTQAHVL